MKVATRILLLWNMEPQDSSAQPTGETGATPPALQTGSSAVSPQTPANSGADHKATSELPLDNAVEGTKEITTDAPAIAATAATTEQAPGATPPLSEFAAMKRAVEMLAAALEEEGVDVRVTNLEGNIARLVDAVTVHDPHATWSLVRSFPGSVGAHSIIPDIVASLEYPVIGSESAVVAACTDRALCHAALHRNHLPVPNWSLITDASEFTVDGLRFPCIVTQPCDDIYEIEGQESAVPSLEAAAPRVETLARDYALPFMLEEYIEGRRFHVLVYGWPNLLTSPVIEEVAIPIGGAGVSTEPGEAVDDNVSPAAEEADAASEPESHADEAANLHVEPTDTASHAELSAETAEEADVEDASDAPANSDEPADDAEDDTEDETAYRFEYRLANVAPETAFMVRDLASEAARKMGVRDIGMVDIHVDDEGKAYIVDVRPVVDLVGEAPFWAAATAASETLGQTIGYAARGALRRAGIPWVTRSDVFRAKLEARLAAARKRNDLAAKKAPTVDGANATEQPAVSTPDSAPESRE